MLGGAFLCYEGTEKVFEALWPHAAHKHEAAIGVAHQDPKRLEDSKVNGAIKTDFILSAEIMAITLASVPESSFWMQAMVLAAVGIGITAVVYGGVAFIVKADDVGVAMAANPAPISNPTGKLTQAGQVASPTRFDRLVNPVTRAFGRGLVKGMPIFLKLLALVGTAAMIWVGGGIIIHGLEEFGFPAVGHALHVVAEAAAHAAPVAPAAVEWIVTAAGSGVFGLVVGAILIPIVQFGAKLFRRSGGGHGAGAAPSTDA
jgi:predicted DNA repair protein MutK